MSSNVVYMTYRIKRKSKTIKLLLDDGYIFKMNIHPYMKISTGKVWLVGWAIGKSNRQINDWMCRRSKRSRVYKLSNNKPKKRNQHAHWICINIMRKWLEELPEGDGMAIRCEAASSDKQFRVWKKWFKKNEDPDWKISDEHKSFFFYKKTT